MFVDQFNGSSLDQSGLNNQTISLDTFFSGDYGNPYRNDSRPFFENPREAKMNKLKYAPCKFCVLYKSDGSKVDFTKIQSSTTVIQSLGEPIFVTPTLSEFEIFNKATLKIHNCLVSWLF